MLCAIAFFIGCLLTLRGQTSQENPASPEFEVVSIKPDVGIDAPVKQHEFFACRGTDGSTRDWMETSLPANSTVQVPAGRCLGIRTSLGMLLDAAYGVRRATKKPGAPTWTETD